MSSSKNNHNDAYDPSLDQNFQLAQKAMMILTKGGYEARMAGGCVRDRILKIRPKDYDIATTANPDAVCAIFAQNNVKTVATGIDHGTVTVVLGGQGIEVTSLRKDVATDGRRAVVSFGSSFEEDSIRRDFTINALYEDQEGRIYDFHGGLDDLQNGCLRFVGDARTRIQEDYLRILRLFRFWARFGFQPEPGILSIVAEEVRGLDQISQERKTSELTLILESKGGPGVLPAMATSGTLQRVLALTTFKDRPAADWDVLFLNNKARTFAARMTALLMLFDNKEAQSASLEVLRLARSQVAAVQTLLHESLPGAAEDPAVAFDWLDRMEKELGEHAWEELLYPAWKVLRPNPRLDVLNQTFLAFADRRVCPVNGQFLIQNLKLKPGPALGQLLHHLKAGYRRREWTTKPEALVLANKYLA